MRKGRGLRCDGCRASMPAVQATVTATALFCPACVVASDTRQAGAKSLGLSGARGTPDDRAPVTPRAPA